MLKLIFCDVYGIEFSVAVKLGYYCISFNVFVAALPVYNSVRMTDLMFASCVSLPESIFHTIFKQCIC